MEANRFIRTNVTRHLDRVAAWTAGWLLTRRGFLAALCLYVLGLYLIKAVLYSGGLGHDVDQIVISQTTQLGYDNRNPPLYTWLVIAVQTVIGVGLPAVLLVKSAAILSLYLFLYLAARRMLRDEATAILAALAPFAMYEVGVWLAVKYSHTAGLAALCAITFYVLLRLEKAGTTAWYAILGATIGIGLLAKYNYAVYLVVLVIACTFDSGFRARFRDRRMLLTAAIAILLILPHAYWMVVHAADFKASAASRFGMGSDQPALTRFALGLLGAVKAILNMLLPLVLVVPFLAWTAYRKGLPDEWSAKRYYRILGLFLLLSIAAIFLLVAVSGATQVRGHYLLVFVIAPLWLFAWIEGLGLSRNALNRFALAFALLALAAPLLMIGKYFTHPAFREYAQYNLPYAKLAQDLRAAGFQRGTLFAFDYPYTLSGNLRAYFPESRILSSSITHSRAPERGETGQCLLLWTVDRKSTSEPVMLRMAEELLGFTGRDGSQLLESDVEIVGGSGRRVKFQYRLFAEGPGSCH